MFLIPYDYSFRNRHIYNILEKIGPRFICEHPLFFGEGSICIIYPLHFFVPKRPKQWGANHHKNHSPLTQLPFRKGFSFLLEVCQCFCMVFCKMHMICVKKDSMILQEVEKDRVTSCWVTWIITCLVLSGNFLYTHSFCCWSGGSVFTLKCFSLAFFRWIWDFKKIARFKPCVFFGDIHPTCSTQGHHGHWW